jgi:hypothetical protein
MRHASLMSAAEAGNNYLGDTLQAQGAWQATKAKRTSSPSQRRHRHSASHRGPAGRHPKQDVTLTVMRLAVREQLEERAGKYTLPPAEAEPG